WRKVPLSLSGASWAWQLDTGDLLWGATAIVMSLLMEVAVEDWSGGRRPEDLPDDRAVMPWEDAPSWQRPARLSGDLPQWRQEDVPHVTAAQMRQVDRLLADAGLDLEALVEQAGRAIAHAVRRLLGERLDGATVTVLAGPGGNGAGGLAAARLFAAAGADVHVLLTGDPAVPSQLDTLNLAEVNWSVVDGAGPGEGTSPGDVVIDAMLGYGAEPPLRGVPDAVNAWLQRFAVPVVALDLPSGLGADEGLRGACVNADVTVTLGAPKQGLRPRIVHPYVGDLYLADIGIPPAVWKHIGIEPVVFPEGPLVRLTTDDPAPDAGTPDQGAVPDG
ncbi:MAG: NAD(P)H-hydrate epimerase, partial [Nitriliruptorales bacterium]|nr:NAD(P)H-hydrate epimerase [Nitriliruptorales bacterium]